MSAPQPTSTSGDRSPVDKLAASALRLLSDTVLRPLAGAAAAGSSSSSQPERALVLAVVTGAVPFMASLLWYYSRTVIEIRDPERSMWIQTWMDRECSASIRRLRRLVLVGSRSQMSDRQRQKLAVRGVVSVAQEEKEDSEGGRFSPPKLSFEPPSGTSCWAWHGWWPVSVRASAVTASNPFEPPFRSPQKPSYFLTVWFAPRGIAVARALLLEGRELCLARRAKRTEIWIAQIVAFGMGGGRNAFSVVSRPSRPLSTVIIGGDTKRILREDAIRFLNAERWYVEKGIPYRRGFLLYGPPGCGKTSLVTALAGDLRLPIVLINLGTKDMTDSCLIKFLSEIPRDSIVLLEDIDRAIRVNRSGGDGGATAAATEPTDAEKSDAMAAALLGKAGAGVRVGAAAGTVTANTTRAELMAKAMGTRSNRKGIGPGAPSQAGVTMSGLLNAIDGVGAQEGRILIMTTNTIENLDEALIRPGRVDAKFYIGKASKAAAGQLFDQFFRSRGGGENRESGPPSGNDGADDTRARDTALDPETSASPRGNADPGLDSARAEFLERVRDGVHSFAELQGVLMKARDDPAGVGAAMTEFLESPSSS